MRRFLLVIGVIVSLTGCGSAELVAVPYEGPIGRTSDKTASIELASVPVETTDISEFEDTNLFVPIATSGSPEIQFNIKDQRIFVESLKQELNRLKLLRVNRISEQRVEGTDISIQMRFMQTAHISRMHEYYLKVGMKLKSGERSLVKRYEILSSEGDSIWTKMRTDAAQGKEEAARKLMVKIIPDIEQFVGNLPK
jgi:hypothetical protein